MGFRTDIRLPVSQATLSSTTSVLGSVTVTPASEQQRVVVTGVSFAYGTAFTVITPAPKIFQASPAKTLFQFTNIITSTWVTFITPLVGDFGAAVTAQATCTAAAQTIGVSMLYYLDNR